MWSSYVLIFAASLSSLGCSSASSHWGYPDYNENEEFPKWGGICDTGRRQSPINLSIKGAVKGIYSDKLEGYNHDKTIKQATLVNTGHSIQLSNFDVRLKLQGGPLKEEYILEQLHFHWWSEHTIDNIRYPFEMHMVHRNRKYENMTVATQNKDGLSVVGVLYHAAMERNSVVDDVLMDLVQVMSFEQISKPVKIKVTFKMSDLLPEINSYITYEGSLTTPSCAESVTWIVIAQTFPVTIDQVDAFKSLEVEKGKALVNNYRAIQKLNNRAIIIAFNDESSGSVSITPNTAGSLMAIAIVGVLVKYLN